MTTRTALGDNRFGHSHAGPEFRRCGDRGRSGRFRRNHILMPVIQASKAPLQIRFAWLWTGPTRWVIDAGGNDPQ